MIWFAHRKVIYTTEHGRFEWTRPTREQGKNWKVWNWDNCTVSLAKPSPDRTLVVVRSSANKNSRYMGDRPVRIRFMLGFEVKEVLSGNKPVVEKAGDGWDGPRDRYVIQLRGRPSVESPVSDGYWIWVYDDDTSGKEVLERLLMGITSPLGSDDGGVVDGTHPSGSVFKVNDASGAGEIIPVIYQPAVDSLKNFVREVHCKRTEAGDEIEVTLIFENEHLQRTQGADKAYRFARKDLFFGREKDVESFRIRLDERGRPSHFIFPGIYSKLYDGSGGLVERDMQSDDVHGDAGKRDAAPLRPIKHCFLNRDHPIVFVNTSNHAMAEDDANNRLWKWEYVPWEEDGTLEFGRHSRREVEAMFPPPPFRGIPKLIIFDIGNRLWRRIKRLK